MRAVTAFNYANCFSHLTLPPLAASFCHPWGFYFESDAKPMELAALSQQEMKETEGAVIWFYYGGAMLLVNAPTITRFGMNMVNSSAYQPWGHAFNYINSQRMTYFPNTRWW